MNEQRPFDVAIIGGGIIGTATAMALSRKHGARVVILEAEDKLAAHQTGHNSGVIHSGLYYKPGSLKAVNCTRGREALYAFCEKHGIAHDRCGKVVVATRPEEIPALDDLERRGRANGLDGLRRITAEEIREHEPHITGIDGLHVPQTGIVDYSEVTAAYARIVQEHGGEIRLSHRVTGIVRESQGMVVETRRGEIRARHLVNCAGLQCDRIALKCGVQPGLQIVPFRGEYYELVPEKQYLVKHLVYPVPDPRFPFLGVHFTRMIGGGVEAGPNAVLALKREGYGWSRVSLGDMAEYVTYGGFWRMSAKYWKTGIGEVQRSLSKSAFVKALRRLLPELQIEDIHPGGAGVRAQALEPSGKLVDDFRIVEAPGQIHVLNAPSPAATASMSIGEAVAEMAAKNFDLARPAATQAQLVT